jgi:hypothetical protein
MGWKRHPVENEVVGRTQSRVICILHSRSDRESWDILAGQTFCREKLLASRLVVSDWRECELIIFFLESWTFNKTDKYWSRQGKSWVEEAAPKCWSDSGFYLAYLGLRYLIVQPGCQICIYTIVWIGLYNVKCDVPNCWYVHSLCFLTHSTPLWRLWVASQSVHMGIKLQCCTLLPSSDSRREFAILWCCSADKLRQAIQADPGCSDWVGLQTGVAWGGSMAVVQQLMLYCETISKGLRERISHSCQQTGYKDNKWKCPQTTISFILC